jgi:hypothetical protein
MLLEGYFHISILHHSIKDCHFGVDSDDHIKVNIFTNKYLHKCIRKQSAFICWWVGKIYICIMKRLVNVGPEFWSWIEISELLYFTLNQCSQFSSLPLLMWPESPSPVIGHFFGSICRSPVFELGRCSLESVYCDDMVNFVCVSTKILETEKSCVELAVQNTEDGYLVMQPLVETFGFHKRWRI